MEKEKGGDGPTCDVFQHSGLDLGSPGWRFGEADEWRMEHIGFADLNRIT